MKLGFVNDRLILFDIDQTLIQSAGCGRRGLEKAFREVLGIENALDGLSMSGKTDTYIVFEVLEKNNKLQALTPKKDLFLWERYLHHLQLELEASAEARTADGIPELLGALSEAPLTHLALLTGNIRSGAKTKLDHFKLWDYFPVGAFGDDHLDRNIVAQIALDRSRKWFNRNFESENIYVVGDSVRDIKAAEAIHAKSIIAATGVDSYESLAAHPPFALFRDFSDTAAVLAALSGIVLAAGPDHTP